MEIIIKKKIALGFLGDEYKDSYINLKAIPVKELESLDGTIKEEVVKRFVDGKINQDGKMIDITKENLFDLPGEVFIEGFAQISGKKLDPKE